MENSHYCESYDPYKEMHKFYRLDDPTDEQQFRFVEATDNFILLL